MGDNSLVEGLEGEEGKRLLGPGHTLTPWTGAATLFGAEACPDCDPTPAPGPSVEAEVGREQAGKSRNLAIQVVGERIREGTEVLRQTNHVGDADRSVRLSGEGGEVIVVKTPMCVTRSPWSQDAEPTRGGACRRRLPP